MSNLTISTTPNAIVADGSKWNALQPQPGVFVCILDVAQLRQHAGATIWRTNDAMYTDPVAFEHLRRSQAARYPWGVYVYFRSTHDPVRQADLCHAIVRRAVGNLLPPCGVWADFEEEAPILGRDAYFRSMEAFLRRLDENFQTTAGIYSRASWLDHWVAPVNQLKWSHRELWLAAPGADQPDIPYGWKLKPRPYLLHQFSWKGNLPGLGAPLDLNKFHPRASLADLAPRFESDLQIIFAPIVVDGIPSELAGQLRDHLNAMLEDLAQHKRVLPYGSVTLQVPVPPGTTSLALLTNQAVINLFASAFGKADYWAKLAQATLTNLIHAREAMFVGPSIEEMTLTDADKEALKAKLFQS